MGASIGTSRNVITQTSTNNIYQSSYNVCSASCTVQDNGLIVVVQDSKIGFLNLSQACDADALCVMKTNLQAITSQQLAAQESNTLLSPGGFFNYNFYRNSNYSTQTLSNVYTQTIDNLCQAEANAYRSNTIVLITDTEVVGEVDLSQSTSAQAACAIENTASASVVQVSEATLTNVTKTGSVLIVLSVVIAIVLVSIGTAYVAAEQKKNEGEARTAQLQALVNSPVGSNLQANEINAILAGAPIIYEQ